MLAITVSTYGRGLNFAGEDWPIKVFGFVVMIVFLILLDYAKRKMK